MKKTLLTALLLVYGMTLSGQENRVNQIRFQISTCEDKATELWFEIANLREQKETAIEELRSGRYCSKCNRPASTIERTLKMTFAKHLGDVKGESIPASKETIEREIKQWDNKIAAKERAHKSQETRCSNLEEAMNNAIREEEERKRKAAEREREEAKRQREAEKRKKESEVKAEESIKETERKKEAAEDEKQAEARATAQKNAAQIEYERRQLIKQQIQRENQMAQNAANNKYNQIMRNLNNTDLGENHRKKALSKSDKFERYERGRSNTDFEKYTKDSPYDNRADIEGNYEKADLPATEEATDWGSSIAEGLRAGGSMIGEIRKEARAFLNEKIDQSISWDQSSNTYEDFDIISDLSDIALNSRLYHGSKAISGHAQRAVSAVIDIGKRNLQLANRVFDVMDYEENGAELIEQELNDWKKSFAWSVAGIIPGVTTARSWYEKLSSSETLNEINNSKPARFIKDFGHFVFTGKLLYND